MITEVQTTQRAAKRHKMTDASRKVMRNYKEAAIKESEVSNKTTTTTTHSVHMFVKRHKLNYKDGNSKTRQIQSSNYSSKTQNNYPRAQNNNK